MLLLVVIGNDDVVRDVMADGQYLVSGGQWSAYHHDGVRGAVQRQSRPHADRSRRDGCHQPRQVRRTAQ